MRKFLLWSTLVGLITLGIGSHLQPDQGLFWLSNPDLSTQIVRGVLAVFIIIQLATEPPRHLLIRISTGMTALVAAFWSFYSLTLMSTPIFDFMMFMTSAIALGVAALELTPKDKASIVRDTAVGLAD